MEQREEVADCNKGKTSLNHFKAAIKEIQLFKEKSNVTDLE